MNRLQRQVKEFHEAFDITINDKPCQPSGKDIGLRANLIEEEFEEFIEASNVSFDFIKDDDGKWKINWQFRDNGKKVDLVELADALGDLLYVIYGTAVTYGIDLEPITDEIHRSNMTKVGGKKREDGKLLKPDTYEPAQLKRILEEQQFREVD